MSAEPTVVLVDMDMVICDFEQQLLKEFRRKFSDERYIPLEERSGESAEKQYSEIRKDLGCQWIEQHLGKDWLERLIHVNDKTLINGHLLIDDDTSIRGGEIPAWEHVVFTACHNVNSPIGNKKRLNNWTDGSWREIIQNIKK